MDQHGVDISVLSLGNAWSDFLITEDERREAGQVASSINKEMEDMCCAYEGRLYYFAVLPLTAPLPTVLVIVETLASYQHCRGVVMGYAGFDSGMDDPLFVPVLEAVAKAGLPVFFHPNYGLPNNVF
jgi:aminocarboxymuconate-semialdehyde decarboxylase